MKCFRVMVMVSCVFFVSSCTSAESVYKCSFVKGGWDPNDWTLVKSPRWDHFGGWVQKDGHIENETPAGATAESMISARAAETYSSMVLKKQIEGAVTITSTMDFAYRMAPLIVITPEFGKDAKGRAEHREHFEIVIFDEGVNVWHHYYKDGKPFWKKAAYSKFLLKPNVKYEVKAKIATTARGKMLSVFVGDEEFGYIDDSLPDKFYVGITGCEGVNRFYDFSIENEKKK